MENAFLKKTGQFFLFSHSIQQRNSIFFTPLLSKNPFCSHTVKPSWYTCVCLYKPQNCGNKVRNYLFDTYHHHHHLHSQTRSTHFFFQTWWIRLDGTARKAKIPYPITCSSTASFVPLVYCLSITSTNLLTWKPRKLACTFLSFVVILCLSDSLKKSMYSKLLE